MVFFFWKIAINIIIGLNILKPAGIPTLSYSDFKVLAALPQAQVNLNPLIKQNPGY